MNMKFEPVVLTLALFLCFCKGSANKDVNLDVELPTLNAELSPIALPPANEEHGIIITTGWKELNAEIQCHKKLIIFIYAADPRLNIRLKTILNNVYGHLRINIPIMEVPRIPGNEDIFEEYGMFEPGLCAYEEDSKGRIFKLQLMGGNMNWTYKGLTNFFNIVQKGFKRTMRRLLKKSHPLLTIPPVVRSEIGEKIMGGMQEMEDLIQRNNYKKVIVFVYSVDPFDNVQLEQALDRAIIKTGTKIPVLKVTRSPSNKSIYGPFGNINPGIAAYYPKKSGGFNICMISNENHNWSVQALEYFIRAVETDFKQGPLRLTEFKKDTIPPSVPNRIEAPANAPGISQIVTLAKLRRFKKIFIYVSAKDPEEDKKLEKLVNKAYIASGTMVPLTKISRDPRDQAVYELYGESSPGLGAFELRLSTNVHAISFGENGEKWSVEELTKFFKTHDVKHNYIK